ncbi:MAG: HNH endonuclease [Butyricicoccaceae bacterium]
MDHIKPHRGDWGLFADQNNLESLCHRCHSRKTLAEIKQKRGDFRG